MQAVRMMGTSKHDQGLMDNIQATMTALEGAKSDEEADGILKSLIADFEKPSEIDDARQNEIDNLKKMEEAYDKNLGPKPIKEMYRRMEQSDAVKKVQSQLAASGYELTERDVVKLILRNSRHQLASKRGKSKEDVGLLNKLLRAGSNLLAKDIPSKEEAKLTEVEEAPAPEATPEGKKMADLKGKLGEGVKQALPPWAGPDTSPTDEEVSLDNPSADLVGGSDPLGQLELRKAADADALRQQKDSPGAFDPDYFGP